MNDPTELASLVSTQLASETPLLPRCQPHEILEFQSSDTLRLFSFVWPHSSGMLPHSIE